VRGFLATLAVEATSDARLHGIHVSARIPHVILSFRDAATEALFHGGPRSRTRHLTPAVVKTALRKLDMLNAAAQLEDLRVPPGNRLEALRGDLAGKHSIRINDQWRLVFRWTPAGPAEVHLTDYH